MCFDVCTFLTQISVSLCQISLQQMTHQTSCFSIKTLGKLILLLDNFFINFHRNSCFKWCPTTQHFINQNTEWPPINSLIVTFIEQNFWSYVVRSTTNCKCSIFHYFGKSKITQFNITNFRNQNIFRFQIPISYLIRMQIIQCKNYLGCIERSSKCW